MAPIDRKLLVEFFSRSLSALQSSNSTFQVLCTLPHQHAQPQPCPRRPDEQGSLIVLDSSFNPPTVAHAQMAKDALKSLSGARVVLLLSVNNADKAPQPASFPLRLGMMERLGLELLEEAAGDDTAVDLAVTTMPFFHDKARAMADSGFYSAAGGPPLPAQMFLAGFDTLTRVFDPKYYGGAGGMRAALGPFFAGGARLRITMRPDDAWGTADEQRRWLGGQRLEEEAWKESVDVVEGVGAVVSSSMVRRRVGEGEAVDGLVGEEVRAWIVEEGLYREG